MAFAANTAWEVRTTGNDANGGGFNTAATGTDYSQQDTPQISYTDLVIGATTTQLTSALNPFTSATVGNIINIVSGTGFTVQRVQIVSVSGVTATCDKACGTAASIGGTGSLGGGLITIAKATTLLVLGNTIWIKTGAYAITAAMNIAVNSCYISGYSVTHGDDAAKATINATGSTYAIFNSTASNGNTGVKNISFAAPSASTLTCISNPSASGGWVIANCDFLNFSVGIAATNAFQITVYGCTFVSCTTGISGGSGAVSPYHILVDTCYFNNLQNGILGLAPLNLTIKNSIFNTFSNIAVNMQGSTRSTMVFENNNFTGAAAAAIELPADWNPSTGVAGSFLVLRNNIIYANTLFGVKAGGASVVSLPQQYVCSNNAVGSNPSGNYQNLVSTNDVTLTASPFVSPPNFNLNSATGGGAGCKGAGWPGSFPGATGSISNPDIGALQISSANSTSNYGYTG